MSNLMHIDKEYAAWIEQISQKFRQSQLKAATHVNRELLQFYWTLGKDIVTLHAESKWGDKLMENISNDLRIALPGVKGLSPRNLLYMKGFYLLYREYVERVPQLEA